MAIQKSHTSDTTTTTKTVLATASNNILIRSIVSPMILLTCNQKQAQLHVANTKTASQLTSRLIFPLNTSPGLAMCSLSTTFSLEKKVNGRVRCYFELHIWMIMESRIPCWQLQCNAVLPKFSLLTWPYIQVYISFKRGNMAF